MGNDYTVVIPTYNSRINYLNRILDYFSQFHLNIIIVDSSSEPYANSKDYRFDYLHLPDSGYASKLLIALNKVSTKYALLCADDDFVIPESIDQCVNFLDENPDYASVQGNIVAFEKNREVTNFPWMTGTYNLDINDNLPSSRITSLYKQHIYLHYSVHKKENLLETFKVTESFDDGFAASTTEQLLNIIGVINGKHKVLPIFYYVSEFAQNSGRNLYKSLGYFKKAPKYRESFELYVSQIAQKLSDKEDLTFHESKDKIDEIFDSFTENKENYSKPLEALPWLSSLLKKIPIFDFAKRLYSKIYYAKKRRVQKENFRKSLDQAKNWSGYPYTDESNKSKWMNIKSFIKKHAIYN